MVVALVALVFAMTGTGIAARGLITGKQIKDGSITARDLANGAVTQKKLGRGAVASANVVDGAITQKKLGAAAVAAPNLAPDAVTSPAIAPNAVLTADLAPGSVNGNALADNAVTGRVLADGSVAPRNLLTRLPGASRNSKRGQTRLGTPAVPQQFIICPNGVIVPDTQPCPFIVGTVAATDPANDVQHFEVDDIGDSTGTSECTVALPKWEATRGTLLAPIQNGNYFAQTKSATENPFLYLRVSGEWSNVSETDTTWVHAILQEYTDVDNAIGRDMAFLQTTNVINPGSTTASITAMAGSPDPVGKAYRGGTMACNLKSSGRGAPVLTRLVVEGE